jgi:hypothetical protein
MDLWRSVYLCRSMQLYSECCMLCCILYALCCFLCALTQCSMLYAVCCLLCAVRCAASCCMHTTRCLAGSENSLQGWGVQGSVSAIPLSHYPATPLLQGNRASRTESGQRPRQNCGMPLSPTFPIPGIIKAVPSGPFEKVQNRPPNRFSRKKWWGK